MERAEIAELFYEALIDSNKVELLAQFLSARVQWTLSAADRHTGGETSPPNALKFSGKAALIHSNRRYSNIGSNLLLRVTIC